MKIGVALLVVVYLSCLTAAKNVPQVDFENGAELECTDKWEDFDDTEIPSDVDQIESFVQIPEEMATAAKENGCCRCSGYVCSCNRLVYVRSPYIYRYGYLTIYGYPRQHRMYIRFQLGSRTYVNRYLPAWRASRYSFKLSCGVLFSLEFYSMRVRGSYLCGCAGLRVRNRGYQVAYVTFGCFSIVNPCANNACPRDPQLLTNEDREMEGEADTSVATELIPDLSLQDIISALKEQMQVQDEDQIPEAGNNPEGQFL